MADDSDVTPAILLQHMQGMEHRLRTEFKTGMKELDCKIEKNGIAIVDLTHEIKRVERNLSTQIGNIDQRLDEVEIELLPKRVQVLEEMIGIGK